MTVAFLIAISVIGGLLLFLIREVRRSPGPTQFGRTPRWAKPLRVSLTAIILLIGLLIFYGFLLEPGRLVVHQQTIQIAGWPSELNGLKVAVLSDIHVDDWFVNERKVRTIVERTNQLQPELIVILGDYMSGNGTVRRQ